MSDRGGEARRTLVLYFHPDFTTSKRNKEIVERLQGLDGVTVRNIGKVTKNSRVLLPEQVREEQKLLLQYDRIVFEYPVYWFNIPAIGKQYMDQVFRAGFAYSIRHDNSDYKLQGKRFRLIMTTGAPRSHYDAPERLYHSMKYSADHMGLIWEEPFIYYRDDPPALLDNLIQELMAPTPNAGGHSAADAAGSGTKSPLNIDRDISGS